jgi:hypothetical protein
MNLSGLEPTIYHAQGEHTNNKTSDVVWKLLAPVVLIVLSTDKGT